MYIWVDDVRKPPSNDWLWVRTVREAQVAIMFFERQQTNDMIIIDLDHDAGDCAAYGGDYIKILDWLEQQGIVDNGYLFHIHTMNPVGRDNMRAIINKNHWREIIN